MKEAEEAEGAVKDAAVKLAEEEKAKAKVKQDENQTTGNDESRESQHHDQKDDDDIDDNGDDSSDESSSSSSSFGWTQLMGQDLVMKTISLPNRNSHDDGGDDGNDALAAVQPEDVVRIDFVGRLALTKDQAEAYPLQQQESTLPVIFQEARDVVITIGAKDVVPAIEMGVRFMKVGETALVWSHSKYAHGPGTRHDSSALALASILLPPNSNVCYEITVQHVYSSKERSDAHFPVFVGQSRKSIANDIYAHEWQQDNEPSLSAAAGVVGGGGGGGGGGHGKQRALYLYQRTVKEMLQVVNEEEDNNRNNANRLLRDQALAILLDCLNNIVAVHLRAKEYHAAKLAAVKVLELDPNNIKALIRAAKASLLDPASSYTEVQAALEAATERLSIVQKTIDDTRTSSNDNEDDDKNDATNNGGDDDDAVSSLKMYQADLRRLYVDFSKRQQEYKQRSKTMFSKALGVNDKKNKTPSNDDRSTSKINRASPTTTRPPNDAAGADTDTDTDTDDASPPPWYKNLPWKEKILPLLLQTIVPFLMWYFVHNFQGFPSSLPEDTTTSSSTPGATRKHDNEEL